MPRSISCFFLSFLAVTFALVGLFSLPVLAANPNASLQKFVDAGRVPPGIMKQLNETGSSDIIVTLHVEDIRNIARTKRNERGLKYYDEAIIDEIAVRYDKRKGRVLSRLAKADVVHGKKFTHLPFLHVKVNSKALEALLNQPEVAFVEENRGLEPHLTESLSLINANQIHIAGYTGLGTAVAVLDTGVDYTLADFGSCAAAGDPLPCKVVYAEDFAPPDGLLDDNGHGTNVSGIVAGVAPGADIIGLDVFDPYDGLAWSDDIIDALNWVIANKATYNIVAVNMSLGGGRYTAECPADSLASAIANLKDAGITSAVSSGNDEYLNALGSPACAPDALSVGAVYDANVGYLGYSGCSDSTTAVDKVTCFSNTASFLKMLAPGSLITSAGITMAGTSQAAPHAAGAVALLKEAESLLTVDEVINRMTSTGTPVTDQRVPSITTPRLDVLALLDITTPLIGASPATFTFREQENGSLPAGQSLSITNDGVEAMTWSVSDDAAWLDISPASGSGDGTVTLSINTAALTPGTYNGTVTITSPEASNSPRTVPVSLIVYDELNVEDFESGDLLALPWESYGDGTWAVQGSTVYSGAYAAQSPVMPDSSTSTLEVTLNVTEAGFVRFMAKTSTEEWDKLKFWVDGVNVGKWDGWWGETDWIEAVSEYEILPGFHTFRWVFSKDSSVSVGSDTVWVDTIFFPPFNMDFPEASLDPVSHSFANTAVGGTSSSQSFVVTNTGIANLVLGTATLSGTDAGQFDVLSDTCSGMTIVPTDTCTINIFFQPTSVGAKSAMLVVASNDPFSPQVSAALSGTALTSYPLTVVNAGGGAGSVSSEPAGGIDCGADCTELYIDGTSVTLTATPAYGSSFYGWTGACTGTGDCVLTMNAAKSVTASFSILPPTAAFTASAVTGSAPFIVNFTDTSLYSPTSWLWNFGDGATSTEQHPIHVYAQVGTYTVSLTATNSSGSDLLTMTSYIDAALCANSPVKVGVVTYGDIQTAYGASLDGDVIEMHAGDFLEGLIFNEPVSITLSGGQNCEYTATASATTVNGSLTISAGTVGVENVVIQ